MKYLIDEALLVESAIEEELNEASGKKEKNYYIQGVFSTPGQKNRNGRIYPMNIWEREVQKYQQVIAENSINTLGEYEHPNRTKVDPLEAVMKIVELKMDNGLVCGKAKILNNNSPKTNQLKALIDEGFKIGVSSRGVGSVKGDIVENFSLLTYDIVSEPSDYNANLSGIMESMQDKNFLITESGEIKEVQVEISGKEENLDEANKKILDAKYQLEINQIFNDDNIETMLKIASKIENKTDSHMLTKYLNLLKSVDIKPTEKVRLILEELENSDIPEKVELSEAEKAELRDNIINKFKDLFNSSLNEGIKVNSKMSAIQVIQMAKDKISDEKVKDMLNSAINFLAKEFNVNIEKVNESENKIKYKSYKDILKALKDGEKLYWGNTNYELGLSNDKKYPIDITSKANKDYSYLADIPSEIAKVYSL